LWDRVVQETVVRLAEHSRGARHAKGGKSNTIDLTGVENVP